MQLHFKRYGSGEPLIVLHGLLGSLDNWHSFSQNLARNFCVVAVDQRNHGHSPHSAEMDYRIMANDVRELMDRERLPRAHVLGHSMGGKTAMQFALEYPESTVKLIVVDMAPRGYSPRHVGILSAMMSLDPAGFRTRTEIQQALASAIPDLSLRQFLLKNIESDPDRKLRWRIGLREIYQNYDRLRAALPDVPPYAGPALFLRGEQSDYLTQSDLPAIHRLFPNATLESIPGAAHLVHAENPEAFTARVRQFLGRP